MSLRTRLTLWLALAATSLVVAAGTLVWVAVGQQLRLGLDETLRLHAESVATALEADPNAPIDNLPSGRPAVFTILYGARRRADPENGDGGRAAGGAAAGPFGARRRERCATSSMRSTARRAGS
ncbi:MAG: hypothetical protein KatS3mg065_0941 [Chloroflexota bacterium]|nr:MAG: hypothetical protein KatS3mg065_0941 [Chloroflexota bacterium]